jgi:hypothetical protein
MGPFVDAVDIAWLEEFPFLMYSVEEDGIYCLSCRYFPVDGQCNRARLLITTPYRDWKDARSTFLKHRTLQYHLDSDCLRRAFVEAREGIQKRVDFA